MNFFILIAAIAAQAADAPHRGSLLQMLDRPIEARLHSAKPREDLEICVVDTFPSFATPVVMRAGKAATVVGGRVTGGFAVAVTLKDEQSGTLIEVRAVKSLDDKIANRLRGCL